MKTEAETEMTLGKENEASPEATRPCRTLRVEEARARFQVALAKKREEDAKRVMVVTTPRYDDVYFEGVAWLDTL